MTIGGLGGLGDKLGRSSSGRESLRISLGRILTGFLCWFQPGSREAVVGLEHPASDFAVDLFCLWAIDRNSHGRFRHHVPSAPRRHAGWRRDGSDAGRDATRAVVLLPRILKVLGEVC